MSLVEFELEDHIAVIRFNRPEKLNAMSPEMRNEFIAAFRRFTEADDAWVAILTGTGRGFCAGRDLRSEMALGRVRRDSSKPPPMYSSESNILGMPDTDKPLVAAVNGFAMGLGWYMVLDCDIRIAAAGAEFGMTEVPTGVLGPYWLSGAESLPWAIAAELALVGERVRAERLLTLGLLNAVVPADQLMDEARRWAKKIADLPPMHVRRTKALMREMRRLPGPDVVAKEREEREYLGDLQDTVEAVTAWQEKRPAQYSGR
jgi:E-phenylitaconyl-CoA hydratase